MSAIWGTVNFDFFPLSVSYINAMEAPYKQYKIDRFENKYRNNVIMGCCLQYITRESYYETLPIFDNDIYITADCVLDNRLELLSELAITNYFIPDGNLILRAYKRWGADCVTHLRGSFSYAIYDTSKNKLILATDHTSSRCLYYCLKDKQCCFSTLLKPILAVNPNTISINDQFIYDALSINGPRLSLDPTLTPYKDIYKIEAGTYVTIDTNSITKTVYWTPLMHKNKASYASKEEYNIHFKRLIKDCVSSALRTNKNVGISLNNTLSSSAIGPIAASKLKRSNKFLYSYTYASYYNYMINNNHLYINPFFKYYPNVKSSFLSNDSNNICKELDTLLNLLELPIKAVQDTTVFNDVFKQAAKDGCKVILSSHYNNIFYPKNLNMNFIKNFLLYPIKRFCYYLKNNLIDNTYVNQKNLSINKMNKRLRKYHLNTEHYIFRTLDMYKKCLYDTCSMSYTGELDTKLGLYNGLLIKDPSKDMRILEFCSDIPLERFIDNNIIQLVIHDNMQEYISSCISNSLSITRFQNTDWSLLNKQWSNIKNELKETCITSNLEKYVDISKVTNFFSKNDMQICKEYEADTNYIFFISSLNKWLENEQRFSF